MKIYHFILILNLMLFVFSCKKDDDAIIKRSEMVEIMAEIHLADARIDFSETNVKHRNQAAVNYYESIFRKHHTNRKAFQNTMKFYLKHPQDLDSLYSDVVINIKTKAELLKKYPVNPAK